MSALEKILGSYSVGHALKHKGRAFTFGRIDLGKVTELSAAYFARVRDNVEALPLPPDQKARQLDRAVDAYNRGDYSVMRQGSDAYRYYLSEAGLPEFISHITGEALPDCETLMAERGIEALVLCMVVMVESFPDGKKKLALNLRDEPQVELLWQTLQAAWVQNRSAPNGSTRSCATPPPGSPRAATDPTGSRDSPPDSSPTSSLTSGTMKGG